MNKPVGWLGAGVAAACAAVCLGGGAMKSVYDFTLNDIDGHAVPLANYKGQVLLLVNVASKCGFTKQYGDLQRLYTNYQARGFAVLGFPANNFLGQEPGTEEQIKQFCSLTYGVTFPMFAKISVKGEDQHPLYAYLTDKAAHPEFGGAISWNFNKFLIGRNGRVLARFGSRDAPLDPKVVAAVEAALTEPVPAASAPVDPAPK